VGWVCGGPLYFYRVSLVLRSTMFVNCGVLCGMRGINFESGQVFFVRCRCVRVIERVRGPELKGSLWTLGIERISCISLVFYKTSVTKMHGTMNIKFVAISLYPDICMVPLLLIPDNF